MNKGTVSINIVVSVAVVLIAGLFGYTLQQVGVLSQQVATLKSDLASTTAQLYGTTGALSNNLADLHSQTIGISQTLSSTTQDIAAVQGKVGGVEQVVGSINGAVSTLQKRVTVDSELLKKYSKISFLNENYKPAHLSPVSQDVVYSNARTEQFLSEALPFLQSMIVGAQATGAKLYVSSAYRSFSEQQSLKSGYKVTYGAGTANAFSADQGYSEHQLGTTIDFITQGSGGQLTTSFEKTKEFEWLSQNAYKFGFQMSYPKGNKYYVYEPWHWRYVGVKLATYLHDNKMNFYDMDQRDIDMYLASLFD